MPNPISPSTTPVQGTSTAAFSQTQNAGPSTSQAPPQDVLDISVTQTDVKKTRQATYRTYGTPDLASRFRYDIEQGMFNQNLRYSAIDEPSRFDREVRSTYETRRSISSQIIPGNFGALFALHFQDAQPNPQSPSTHVDARAEQNRQLDQNLNLLNML